MIKNKLFKTEAGFTLIELLVVIAIIGMLSAIVLASLNSTRGKARDARRVSDIKNLQLALEMYYDSNGAYPPTSGNGNLNALNILVPNYIPKVPNDPLNTNPTTDWTTTNNSYYYWSGMVGACGPYGYTLWYHLENNSNGNANGCVHPDNNSFTLNP